MFVKAAMIYAALTVTVALSMEEDRNAISDGRNDSISAASQACLEVESVDNVVMTPSKTLNVTFSSDVEERDYTKDDHVTYEKEVFSPGLPGLVSPGCLPNDKNSEQC